MSRLRFRLVIVLAALSVSLPAASARAGGPHFMAEGGIGLVYALSDADTTEAGRTASVIVGVGGRPAGSWLRYYFVFETLFAGYDRTFEQNLRTLSIERNLLEFGLGGRIVAPLTPHFRLFADGEVVCLRTASVFDGAHLATTESSELDFGFRLAGGVQYRPIEIFSVGLRASVTAALDELDSNAAAGWLSDLDSESGHAEATVQLTFYF